VMLGLYALGSAMITGIARLSFGIGEALSSRYITMSSLFLVSLLMLVWLSRDSISRGLGKLYRPGMIAASVCLYGLVLFNTAWGVHAARVQHAKLVAAHNCTQVPQPTDACAMTIYPDSSIVQPRIQYLKTIHWGGY
jgi:hypothetical protein